MNENLTIDELFQDAPDLPENPTHYMEWYNNLIESSKLHLTKDIEQGLGYGSPIGFAFKYDEIEDSFNSDNWLDPLCIRVRIIIERLFYEYFGDDLKPGVEYEGLLESDGTKFTKGDLYLTLTKLRSEQYYDQSTYVIETGERGKTVETYLISWYKRRGRTEAFTTMNLSPIELEEAVDLCRFIEEFINQK